MRGSTVTPSIPTWLRGNAPSIRRSRPDQCLSSPNTMFVNHHSQSPTTGTGLMLEMEQSRPNTMTTHHANGEDRRIDG